MKHANLIIVGLFGVANLFSACQNKNANAEEIVVEESIPKSVYFDRIIFAEGGDFLGVTLGETKDDALSKLPADAQTEKTPNYTYFEWQLDSNVYYIDLYFDENQLLASIDGYVYFYNANKIYDVDAANVFYDNLKEYFSQKYGELEEIESEVKYSFWNLEDKTIEVGLNEGEVYWFILQKPTVELEEPI
jgi:hypothetical protein